MNGDLALHTLKAICRTMEHVSPNSHVAEYKGVLLCSIESEGELYQMFLLEASSLEEDISRVWDLFVKQVEHFYKEMPSFFAELYAKANSNEARALFELELLAV